MAKTVIFIYPHAFRMERTGDREHIQVFDLYNGPREEKTKSLKQVSAFTPNSNLKLLLYTNCSTINCVQPTRSLLASPSDMQREF